MKIYTKIGDQGETRLGDGKSVAKTDARILAYGTLDELNAVIGLALTAMSNQDATNLLREVQAKLFAVGALLANPRLLDAATRGESPEGMMAKAKLEEKDVADLESAIDRHEAKLPPLKNFILPGGAPGAAHLHVARTVCRRAERQLTSLHQEKALPKTFLPYINRLSDLLFVLARYENQLKSVEDIPW